ncbi:MAG TPA: DUF4089 domain-containing protein [Acetobacteraceae bacterium]|jgi:hypothetical protein
MNDNDLNEFIASGTTLLNIPVEPEWQPAIRMHLAISFSLAARVLEFTLPDEADPAPVFRA